ncbi:MAG: hypothetical protein WD877_02745 [Candidatus Saccharimonadales bacterium]
MSERYLDNENFADTENDAIKDPSLRPAYRNERVAKIKAGEETWMLRNFDGPSDMEPGIIIDYYAGGRHCGYIDGDDQEGWFMYGRDIGDEQEEQSQLTDPPTIIQLNTEPVAYRSEAQRRLSDYVKETILKFN